MLSALRAGQWHTVATHGDLDHPRPWASVSKLLTALGAAIELQEGRAALDDPLGPEGATLADVLSHASGLGLEVADPTIAPGTRRIYSNCGIDIAAAYLSFLADVTPDGDVAQWLRQRVLAPLSMNTTRLVGRASEGAVGSTRDLDAFAREWITPSLISPERRDASVNVYRDDLAGVVPGFGRFSPCPWGLGVEVRGDKRHWMGEWPRSSFGHFGRSGALTLINVDEGICVVATSTVEFGPWARELWPTWSTHMREFALSS